LTIRDDTVLFAQRDRADPYQVFNFFLFWILAFLCFYREISLTYWSINDVALEERNYMLSRSQGCIWLSGLRNRECCHRQSNPTQDQSRSWLPSM
jgi:hypothetical protein